MIYWMEDAAAAGVDPPPFDFPADMPAWWSLVYPRRKCPESIVTAARNAAQPAAPVAALPPVPVLQEVGEVLGSERKSQQREGGVPVPDYEKNLARLVAQREQCWLDFEVVRDDPNSSAAAVALRQKDFREAEVAARAAESYAQKMRLESGVLVERAEVARVLVPMLHALGLEVRAALRRSWDSLRRAPDESAREMIYQKELDSSFSALERGGFLSAPEDFRLC